MFLRGSVVGVVGCVKASVEKGRDESVDAPLVQPTEATCTGRIIAEDGPALKQRAQELVEKMAAELELERSEVKAALDEICGIGGQLNNVFESLANQVRAATAAVFSP